MFNKDGEKPKEGSSGGIKKPSIEIAGGTVTPERIKTGSGDTAYGFKYTRKFWAKGGKVSSASSRADGCAIKGKTRGKMV